MNTDGCLRNQIRTMMQRSLLLLTLLGTSGCDWASTPVTASPEKATEALEKALTAWKEGKAETELKPEIYAQDPDWMKGRRLLGHAVVSAGEVLGASYSVQVELTLADADGKSESKKVWYIVSTSPETTVIRDLFHP